MAVLGVDGVWSGGTVLSEDFLIPERFAGGGVEAEGAEGAIGFGAVFFAFGDDGGGEVEFAV